MPRPPSTGASKTTLELDEDQKQKLLAIMKDRGMKTMSEYFRSCIDRDFRSMRRVQAAAG